jgi:hypothetical protein
MLHTFRSILSAKKLGSRSIRNEMAPAIGVIRVRASNPSLSAASACRISMRSCNRVGADIDCISGFVLIGCSPARLRPSRTRRRDGPSVWKRGVVIMQLAVRYRTVERYDGRRSKKRPTDRFLSISLRPLQVRRSGSNCYPQGRSGLPRFQTSRRPKRLLPGSDPTPWCWSAMAACSSPDR